jgi:hypothetical protein
LRLKNRRIQYLLAQIDRRVQQNPRRAVNSCRNARLRARLYAPIARPSERANSTSAIPLWDSTAGR